MNRSWILVTIFCLLVALAMRLPAFGQLPQGLNRDEAALGYNAYSLLKTGQDEWGTSWPVSIASFGDQKLPGYVYTLIPFIALLDLSITTIRLPSFLAGLVVLVSMGWLAVLVARSCKFSPQLQVGLSFGVMIFLALSPWEMHFSRVAYEAHLAMALFVSGLTFYWWAVNSLKKKWWMLVVTALLWSGSLLTYHSYHLFLPLFALSLLVIDWKKLKTLPLPAWISLGVVGVVTATVLIGGGVLQANAVKNQGITPLSTQALLNQATEYRSAVAAPALLEKLLFNKASEGVVVFAQNYLTSFSGQFFFVHGSNHGDHNPGHINNFSLVVAPALILGLIALWELRKQAPVSRLGWWLVLGFVPASLTISPLHEVRMSPVFPVIELLAALGLLWLWTQLKRPLGKKIMLGSVLVVLFIAGLRTYLTYLKIAPAEAVSNEKYHLLARALARYQNQAGLLITQSPSSSPYIWFVVENKVDPVWFHQHVENYPATDEGFLHVKQLGTISFETVEWQAVYERAATQPIILLMQPQELSPDQRQDSRWSWLEDIVDAQGEVVYEVWRVTES